jgi:hypothetical protein
MRRVRKYDLRANRHTFRTNCQVVRERDFRLVADEIRNVSTTGVLVTPADPVMTGERLFVSFQLPGTDSWIDAQGTVTRVIHGRRPGEHSRSFGVEFDELDGWQRYVLRRALKGVPLVPPGGRPGRRCTRSILRALATQTLPPLFPALSLSALAIMNNFGSSLG